MFKTIYITALQLLLKRNQWFDNILKQHILTELKRYSLYKYIDTTCYHLREYSINCFLEADFRCKTVFKSQRK